VGAALRDEPEPGRDRLEQAPTLVGRERDHAGRAAERPHLRHLVAQEAVVEARRLLKRQWRAEPGFALARFRGLRQHRDPAAAGAAVVINYVTNPAAAEAVAAEIRAGGAEAMALQADVSNELEVREMFAKAIAHFGAIDILVNNAGLQQDAPLADMTLAQWNKV